MRLFLLSSKVIFFPVVYCQKYKCHNQKYEYQLASALLYLILVHDVLVIRNLFSIGMIYSKSDFRSKTKKPRSFVAASNLGK